MEALESWLLLSQIKGLGNKSLKKLWEHFSSARAILKADRRELTKIVGEAKAKAISDREGVSGRALGELLKVIEREGIGYLTLEDEAYPAGIKAIEDPPAVLFYRGRLFDLPLAGIVGTRRPTGYTLNLVKASAAKVVEAGMGVVSGGAKGVDWLAHEGAVERGGHTLCILGCGILKTPNYLLNLLSYPNTLLMSEFPPLQTGDRYTFPKRNRLIAAMSEFVFIPEAGAKSGSLITADYAIKYGRRVYVHIGIGSSDSWEGCYKLLKEGRAQIVKDIEEVLETTAFGGDSLLRFLRTPRKLEEIIEWTGKSYSEVNAILLDMEMEGKLRRVGSYYQAL